MNVDDIVAARIAAARGRIEATRRRRIAQQAARNKGLAQRHAARLRNQAARRPEPPGPEGDVVVELTVEEFHAAARRHLADLGLTYAELAEQAARHDFDSAQAQMVWTCLGDTLPTDFT